MGAARKLLADRAANHLTLLQRPFVEALRFFIRLVPLDWYVRWNFWLQRGRVHPVCVEAFVHRAGDIEELRECMVRDHDVCRC